MKSQTGEKRTGFLKLKRRRDSNVRRGEDVVKIRLESDEKAKESGEKPKTYESCKREAWKVWKLGMRSLISTQKSRTSYKRDRILIKQLGNTN